MHMLPHGAHVTIQPGFELTVTIGGARLRGRFLFLPSTLCAGDAVWLRIQRVDGAPGRAVDISARVACVFTERESRSAWRPLPGGRFSVTIDRASAARPHDTTRERYALGDEDDERAPTEPNGTRASWAQTILDTDRERTTRERAADVTADVTVDGVDYVAVFTAA